MGPRPWRDAGIGIGEGAKDVQGEKASLGSWGTGLGAVRAASWTLWSPRARPVAAGGGKVAHRAVQRTVIGCAHNLKIAPYSNPAPVTPLTLITSLIIRLCCSFLLSFLFFQFYLGSVTVLTPFAVQIIPNFFPREAREREICGPPSSSRWLCSNFCVERTRMRSCRPPARPISPFSGPETETEVCKQWQTPPPRSMRGM